VGCPEHRDSITLYIDGELSDDAAVQVETHLRGCLGCRATVDELIGLAAMLEPKPGAVTVGDETRFWRRFDADLALRIARGETPWWKRGITITLPVPAMGAIVVVVIAAGGLAGHWHRRAATLEFRTAQLQTYLRETRDAALFPASTAKLPAELREALGMQDLPVRTASADSPAMVALAAGERVKAPAAAATTPFVQESAAASAAVAMRAARPMPVRSLSPAKRDAPVRTQIRFIDSEGVLQPGDLY
jgi:hypothetical protein